MGNTRAIDAEVLRQAILGPTDAFSKRTNVNFFRHDLSVHNARLSVKSKRTVLPCFLHSMEFDDRPEQAQRLEKARIRRGFKTASAAAEFFGWNADTYTQHENGTRGITRAAGKYARAYRVSEAWLLTGEGSDAPTEIPVVGIAGAGPDGTVLFATGDGNFGEVPAPTNSTPTTVALEVQGDSMTGIANDGWIVTYDDKHDPSDEHMGEPCVCWLEDDRVLIKTPYPGRGPGLFDLESERGATMRDVPVRYMALVTNIVPRRSAQKWIRREPDARITDAKLAS